MKDQRKKNDDLLSRILLKWYCSLQNLRRNFQDYISALLQNVLDCRNLPHLLPNISHKDLVRLLDPPPKFPCKILSYLTKYNDQGEFFFFNLISDKLEKFEYYMRVYRNQCVQRIIVGGFKLSKSLFLWLKPYLHTEKLKESMEIVKEIDAELNKEFLLRKKISSDKDKTD